MNICVQRLKQTYAGETLQAISWIQMHPTLVFESKYMVEIGKNAPCKNTDAFSQDSVIQTLPQ